MILLIGLNVLFQQKYRISQRYSWINQNITCTSNRDGSFDMRWCDDDSTEDEALYHVDGTLAADGTMELVVDRTKRLKMTTIMRKENGIKLINAGKIK